ncbi:hypothetical protein PUN28_011132 [Cardiocondyla obscurior]|uniref:Gustatory receptor n=1 Tax=Cardiocondyla obscurior TaxID=286306 RepID=A0AAW2FLY9_9HYME
MKLFARPKYFFEAIASLTILNCLLGLRVFEYPREQPRPVLSLIYLIIIYVVYCGGSLRMEEKYYANINLMKLEYILYQLLSYVIIVSVILKMLLGWWHTKHLKAAMMRIMMCEKTMNQMGLQKNYRKLYMNQIYSLTFIIIIFIVFVVVNYDGMFMEETPMHIRLIIMIAANYPLCLLYVSDASFLHWVRQVHLELIKSTRSTNDAYGIQILLSMTISFVFITSLLYYAYSIFWLNLSREVFRREMVPVVGWILFYSSKILVINHMCAMTTIEAANTGDIICELYEPSTTKEFRAEIRDFTLQLIQNPLIFTACGFFNLDHTFIHGVIGSVTTYLVILIQVGDLPSGGKSNSTSRYNETNFTISDSLFTTISYT